ncbi:MAG: histidine kinase [Hyphomicrobium sp.]
MTSSTAAGGQCVRYYDTKGEMKRGECAGLAPSEAAAPAWFSALSSLLFTPGDSAQHDISYKGQSYGSVVVSSDPEAVTARIWREIKHPLILTFLTIISLSISVYIALARALAPTRLVIDGLDKLASGEFAHRLPDFKLAELQRISEVSNLLAGRIETMLAERAELSKRLMNTQEDERRHLARDLHDEFGQNLAAITALAASIERSAKEGCSDLAAEARSLSRSRPR